MQLSHSKSVLHPLATIVTINSETETQYEEQHPECYLTGDVHSHNGIVSASFCFELVSWDYLLYIVDHINQVSKLHFIRFSHS